MTQEPLDERGDDIALIERMLSMSEDGHHRFSRAGVDLLYGIRNDMITRSSVNMTSRQREVVDNMLGGWWYKFNPKEGHRPGYVYIAYSRSQGMFKLGRSRDPKKRVSSMLTVDKSLVLLLAVQSSDAVLTEKTAHAYLAGYRVMGEWFNLPATNREYVMLFLDAARASEYVEINCKIWVPDNIRLQQNLFA